METKNQVKVKEVGVSKHSHELIKNVLKHEEHSPIRIGINVMFVPIEETKRQGSRIRALD